MPDDPIISGSLFTVVDDEDPGSDTMVRITIDAEDRDGYSVKLNPVAGEDAAMEHGLLLNRRNAVALRDELDRHLTWWDTHGATET